MIATFKDPVVFVSNLKAALRAACEDLTRPWMACVLIELGAGVARFVATNGHWVWCNETHFFEIVGVDEKGKPIPGSSTATLRIPIQDMKRIIRGINVTKKAERWEVELDTEARTVKQLSASSGFGPEPEEAFPPYRQILPTAVQSAKLATMTYGAALLADVAEAFREIAGWPKKPVGLAIEPAGGEGDPVAITSPLCSSALAVLMPMRGSPPQGEALCARYRRG